MSIRFRGVGTFFTTTLKRARDNVDVQQVSGSTGIGSKQCRRAITMVSMPTSGASASASAIASASGANTITSTLATAANGKHNNSIRARSMSTSKKLTGKEVKAIYESSPPLYLAEGLLVVHKPLTWTCNDVITYIRGILTRDAKERGFTHVVNQDHHRKSRRKKQIMMKVGHDGVTTLDLDPLASGVLVLGIGKGTTVLQSYLEGDNDNERYVAACELGYETDTLDAEGKLVKSAPWDHVKDMAMVEAIIPKFTGKIEQVPPLYSNAIRVGGKMLSEIARKESDEASEKKRKKKKKKKREKEKEEMEIPKREVEIYELKVGTNLEESVMRSGVVDGPRYREAVEKLTEEEAVKAKAAAEEAELAAEVAAAEAAAANDGAKENNVNESENKEGTRKQRRRRSRKHLKPKNNNTKKNFFDQETVPSIQSSDLESLELKLPRFTLSIECSGGTCVRSLVRDIGYELDTVATATGLVRMKQGPFILEDCLRKEDWNAEKIYESIRKIE